MFQAEEFFVRFSEALAEWNLELVESLIAQAAKEVTETFFDFVPGYEKTEKTDGICHRFLFEDGSFLELDIKKFKDEYLGQAWPRHIVGWGLLARNARPVLDKTKFDLPAYTKRMQEIARRREIKRRAIERVAKEEAFHSQKPGMDIPSELCGGQGKQAEELVVAVAKALRERDPSAMEEAFTAVDCATYMGWKSTSQNERSFLHLPLNEAGKRDAYESVQRVGRHWRFQDGSEFLLWITNLDFVQPSASDDLSVPMSLDIVALSDGVPFCMGHALANAVPAVGAKGLFLGFRSAKLAEPDCQRGPWGWVTRFPEMKKRELRSDAYAAWIRTAQEKSYASMLEKALACAFQESVWHMRTEKPAVSTQDSYAYSDPAAEWRENLKFRFKDRSVLSVTLYGHHLTSHHIHVTEMPEKIDVVSVRQ